MSKFKVGDKVAVYNGTKKEIGNVRDIYNDGTLQVSINGSWYYRHEKQCRKLVKKKRREFWLCRNSEIELFRVFFASCLTKEDLATEYNTIIKVREVKDAAQELPKETKSK